MKSRILQGVALLVIFVIAVILFRGCNSTPTEEISSGDSYEGYLPPSP